MNIIFCHPHDQDALWLYLELRRSGRPVTLLTPEQVLQSREWSQSLGDGEDGSIVVTNSGDTVRSSDVGYFVNRAQYVDAPLWRRAAEGEREYVRSEMSALMMSWLFELQQHCLMINAPVGPSLCGPSWNRAQWQHAALAAGFADARSSDEGEEGDERTLVVGSKVIASPPRRGLAARCIELARAAGSPWLEVRSRRNGREFVTADPVPSFRHHGRKFLALFDHQVSGVLS